MNKTMFNRQDSIRIYFIAVCLMLLMSLVIGFAFPNGLSGNAYWLINAVYSLAFGVLAVCYTVGVKANLGCAMRLKRVPNVIHLLLELVAIFALINAMTPVNNWFCDLIELIGLRRPSVGITVDSVTQNFGVAILVLCVIPCFTEEMLFRGVVCNGLTDSIKPWKAILLSGIMFSLFHANPAQTLHQFILGALLTLFVMRSGSLWLGIIGHFFNNLMALILGTTVEPTGFYVNNAAWLVPVGLAVVACVLFVYIKFVKVNTYLIEDRQQTEVSYTLTDKILWGSSLTILLVLWVGVLLS